jgi:hypothetical protein
MVNQMAAYTHSLKMFLNRIRIAKYQPTGNIFEDRMRLHHAKKNAADLGNPPGCITMEVMIENLEKSIAAQKIQRQWRASYYNPDYAMGLKRAVTAVERLCF